MAANPQQPRAKGNMESLVPMAYISTGLLALFMLIETLLRGGSYATVGAALLLVFSVGSYLGFRWALTGSILLAAVLHGLVLSAWTSQTIRPPVIYLFFPPLIILFNVLALYYSAAKNKPDTSHSIETARSESTQSTPQ